MWHGNRLTGKFWTCAVFSALHTEVGLLSLFWAVMWFFSVANGVFLIWIFHAKSVLKRIRFNCLNISI